MRREPAKRIFALLLQAAAIQQLRVVERRYDMPPNGQWNAKVKSRGASLFEGPSCPLSLGIVLWVRFRRRAKTGSMRRRCAGKFAPGAVFAALVCKHCDSPELPRAAMLTTARTSLARGIFCEANAGCPKQAVLFPR